MLGEDMGSYILQLTTESGESGPIKPGAINGGFFPKRKICPLFIAVNNIKESVIDAVVKCSENRRRIPSMGKYVSSSIRRATA